ncbi:MAG: amino acid ABC transporter permease [Pseudomonadota bacterium]
MALLPIEAFVLSKEAPARPPPPRGQIRWRKTLFGDAISAAVTAVIIVTALFVLPKLVQWAVVSGVWTGGPSACHDGGACWAFLREKAPQILFGLYPPNDRWRPILVILLFLGLALWTMPPRHWSVATLWAWAVGVAAALVLMGGGVFGLKAVPTASWGGLPITLLLTVLSLSAGFPLAVLLALGRQSRLPAIRVLCIGFVELVRALPLLTMLFIASLLSPLMLPNGLSIDNFLRALVALTIYAAAYLAEVLRGGLQAIPRGQYEAACALALNKWKTARLIVLPQAIAKVIPPLTNTIVVTVKNTSLVLVVGLFDLLSAGRAALADPVWPAPYTETFLFIALIYFAICFSISRYSLFLERRMASEGRQ